MDADATEGNEESSIIFSPDVVDERIKASLEPLHEQISTLTEMMDRLIQSNSARETSTASSPETRQQYESPFSGVPGSSRFPTVAPLTTEGYSPDTHIMIILWQRLAWIWKRSFLVLRRHSGISLVIAIPKMVLSLAVDIFSFLFFLSVAGSQMVRDEILILRMGQLAL